MNPGKCGFLTSVGCRRWFMLGAVLLPAVLAATEMPLIQTPVVPPGINLFGGDFLVDAPEAKDPVNGGPEEKKPSPFRHTLTFGDGRQFPGELLAVTADTVVWRRPEMREPMRFPRTQVRRIDLRPLPLSGVEDAEETVQFIPEPPTSRDDAKSAPVPATLKVGGADWLFGRVTSADGKTFTLQLEDGTRLPVARSQIEWLYFSTGAWRGFDYAGSTLDLDGCAPEEMKVNVDGATAKISGTHWFGREIATPKCFEVSFDVPAGQEDGLHLWLQPEPLGAIVNDFEQGTVEVCFSSQEISRRITNDHNVLQTSPLPPEAREEKGPASYRIFYDGVGKRIHVWRNRREIGDWPLGSDNEGVVGLLPQIPPVPGADPSDQEPLSGINGVCFERGEGTEGGTAGKSAKDLELNRLRVQPWNGILPGHDTADASQDLFSRADRTPLAGQLKSVAEGSLVISGKRLPGKPGTFVQFPHVPAPLAGADAKLRLRHGEISARNLEIRDGRIRCATSLSTAFSLPTKAIRTILLPYSPDATPVAEDVLVFKDGDELAGHAVSASLPGEVHWKSAYGPEFEFSGEAVAGIRMAIPAGHAVPAGAMAELRTGEKVRGRIISYDGRRLELQHDLLGKITLERGQVARLYPNPQPEVIGGADDPEEWIRQGALIGAPDEIPGSPKKSASQRLWTYLDGSYARHSNAGREFASVARRIPPGLQRFELRFEIVSPLHAAGSGVMLLRNNQRVFLAGGNNEEQSVLIFNPSGRSFARQIPLGQGATQSDRRHGMRLFADLKAGTFHVLYDGRSLGHYQMEKDERKTATEDTVQIGPENTPETISILSGLWIGPWNGEVPQAGARRGAMTTLMNGDVSPNAPGNFHEGKWTLENESGTLEVTTDRLLAIDFGNELTSEPCAGRIWLRDGTKVDVDRFAWDGGTLAAHSSLLGEFRFPAEGIAELVYHPAPFRPPIDEETRTPLATDPDKIPLNPFGNPAVNR